MDICLNGYSDYVSQPQLEVCESAAVPLESHVDGYPEALPAAFLDLDKMPPIIPSSEKYDYSGRACKLLGAVHSVAMTAEALAVGAVINDIADQKKSTHELIYRGVLFSLAFTVWETARFLSIVSMNELCQRPPSPPGGGTKKVYDEGEEDDKDLDDMGRHQFAPLQVEEISWFAKIAAALAAAGAKALEVRKEADESAAAFAGAVGGALFIMPLNPALLEFHNPDSDPI